MGHYFRPGYGTKTGGGTNAERGPVLKVGNKEHAWRLRYDPQADDGRDTIIVTLDKQRVTLTLAKEDRAEGAIFDRFGLFNVQSGMWHAEAYFDDFRHTAKSSRKSP